MAKFSVPEPKHVKEGKTIDFGCDIVIKNYKRWYFDSVFTYTNGNNGLNDGKLYHSCIIDAETEDEAYWEWRKKYWNLLFDPRKGHITSLTITARES